LLYLLLEEGATGDIELHVPCKTRGIKIKHIALKSRKTA